VPTDRPEADGTLEWTETTVVVVKVTCENEVGLGWTYGSAAAKAVVDETLREVVVGADAFGVAGVYERMVRRCRNLGRPGIVASAVSAVDIALWDLKARLLGCSLPDLFGRCRTAVPVYGSGGFTTYDDETTSAQLERWTSELGIPRVKIKVAESWGTEARRDLERVMLARQVIGDEAELFVDANGGYSRKQAITIGSRFVEEAGVSWFEEPVSSDDLEGLRQVRDQLPCDIAAGEYGYDESYFARMTAAGAVDCVQIDVTRCGGYTTWLRVAALAAANGLDVSGHCAPSLHAPVATTIPNLRHVEYFHDHERVDGLLFDGCPMVRSGDLQLASSAPGHGMTAKEPEGLRVA
jgi:L-alanine-DL-glutamate epimerase-like enolase superfamily enzyme